jgi:multidrug efflux pump subunit AcrA (membrane-fusion protein)
VDIVRQTPSKARRTLFPIVIAGTLAVGIVVLGLRGSRASAAPAVESGSVVKAKVRRGDFVRQVPAQGTLVPEHVQWLSAVSAARVAHIEVRPGAVVEPDTVVLVLENAELELAALQAEHQAAQAQAALIQLDVNTSAAEKQQEASLAALQSDLRDAERHASAADLLAPEGLMTELDHGDKTNKVKGLVARASAEASRQQVLETGRTRQLAAQQVEVARLREIAQFRRRQLAALQVRAGIHGVVEDIPLENGQWVAIGTVLAKVAEPDHLKAEVKVAEGSARELHKGLSVRFDAPSGTFHGTVERVDPAVVAGSVRVEVKLDDALPAGARADQTVTGYIEIDRIKDALFVERPTSAAEGSMTGVFRMEPDGVTAQRVNVHFGHGSAGEIEVLGGLKEGDDVIVSDTTGFDASDRVRLK